MVAFGRFLQMVARQMAYIIYLIEVSGNKYQKVTVLKAYYNDSNIHFYSCMDIN